MKLVDRNVTEFVDLMASDAPAPGGGSAAALEGALGTALTAMVCALTLGKKKYADVQDLAAESQKKADSLKARFVDVIDRDTEAFNAVSAVFAMPKDTGLVIPAMVVLLLIAIFCFLIRGVYYAPIGEAGVPKEISAAAMAVAACIGYSPSFWAYPIYGMLIDNFPPEQAYRMIFIVIFCFAVLGVILTTLLGHRIVAKRGLQAEACPTEA